MSDNTEKTSVGNSDWKKRELGALWRREGRNQNFLSGTLKIGEFGVEKEIKVVVFTNKGKLKNERAPDFIVYEDAPREDQFDMASKKVEESEAVEKVIDSATPAEKDTEEDVPQLLQ